MDRAKRCSHTYSIVIVNKFEQTISAPIKSIDPVVRVSDDNGYEYHVATLESTLDDTTLTVGGAVTIARELVEQYGIETLVGKRVKKWVRIAE